MPLSRMIENAVGVLSCVLLAVLLWATFVREEPPAALRAPVPPAPVSSDVLLQVSSQQVADVLAPVLPSSSRVAVHEGRGFALGPGMHTLLDDDLTGFSPGAVVVQGGEGDLDADPGLVRIAVEQMVDRVRITLGEEADVVVIGPVPTGTPSSDLRRVRDEVQAAADAKGVPFVDPFELGADRQQPASLDALAQALVPLLPAGVTGG